MTEEGSDTQFKRIADWDEVGRLVREEADRNALEEYRLTAIGQTRVRRAEEPGHRGTPEHDEAPPADEPHPEFDPTPST
jgi:hypothetical protein